MLKIVLAILAIWLLAAWGLVVNTGILHSWWSFIPVMDKGTALAISAMTTLVGVLLGVVKEALLP